MRYVKALNGQTIICTANLVNSRRLKGTYGNVPPPGKISLMNFLINAHFLGNKLYLTFGVGDLVQDIWFQPGPSFRLVGGRGLDTNVPINPSDSTSISEPVGWTTNDTLTVYASPEKETDKVES